MITFNQAKELMERGAIIKYDDMYLIRYNEDGEMETSLDGIHWIVGVLTCDPPTDYSIFKIVRI